MNSAREIAKSIIAEMEESLRECNPVAARVYQRLAVIDYAQALKRSAERTPEQNHDALRDTYIYAEKAIALGISRESMDASLKHVRDHWLPRLKEI